MKRDLFHAVGLGFLAAGIYLQYGTSWALMTLGAALLVFGVLGRWDK